MSLVFAAVTPHPPLLIPGIGKEEIDKVEKTKKAMETLEQDLYLAKPDVIMIISPHGSLFKESFCVNAYTNFESDFEQFGDMETKQTWPGADFLAVKIAHMGSETNTPIQLISEPKLDHGSAVPLFYLTKHLPGVKVLPIGYSMLDNKAHLDFGYLLKEAIMDSGKRVAIIASGDLSHGLTTDAPAGFSKVGAEFDAKIIELLETRNTTGFAGLDEKFVEGAEQCGYHSFLILLGILRNMDYTFKNYSYEGPFGVGYLVGNFVF